MEIKKAFLRGLLGLELFAFSYFYITGDHGLYSIWGLKDDMLNLQEQTAHLKTEIDVIDAEIEAFNIHPFFKEKVAREQLHLARLDEEIFFLPD